MIGLALECMMALAETYSLMDTTASGRGRSLRLTLRGLMNRNSAACIVGNLDGRTYGAVGEAPMLCRATDWRRFAARDERRLELPYGGRAVVFRGPFRSASH